MAAVNTIKDTRVQVTVSSELIKILEDNKTKIKQIPENMAKALKTAGVNLINEDTDLIDCASLKQSKLDLKLLNDILDKNAKSSKPTELKSPPNAVKTNKKNKNSSKPLELTLYLTDLRWLSQILSSLRAESIIDVYLNDLLEASELKLPKNEIIERNPVLEARCQRLRAEQQNREYRKMTKNVDATLKHYPEDTVAYQMKVMNSQIIAVLQFVVSVAAGFAFGFLGIEWIIGNLDFGLRLLLGVMIALIIALAEIYFLAKKLNEYDNITDTANKAINNTLPAKVKLEAGKKAHED